VNRVSTKLRKRIGVLGASAAVLAGGLTASPIMTGAAHAAYGTCNTVHKYDPPNLGPENYRPVPARTGNGTDCYMGYHQGSTSAVKALQKAILTCHDGTWAANQIRNSGGADGIYGSGTVAAVESLQKLFGLTADGVYGPKTRDKLKWPLYYNDRALDFCERV
jgi:peptidoglycan hydrolase-like protein with peptidoglycan-binding domain